MDIYTQRQFWFRLTLFLILLIWGCRLILPGFSNNAIGSSYWHIVNLGFHEAGHLVFQLFGRFIMVLGGTLGQLLAPVLLMFAFIFRNQDYFGASLCLWWLGESSLDCAPYINDALAQRLTLIHGGTGHDSPGSHDWNYMLNQLGMIQYHRDIAMIFYITGIIIMTSAVIWGGIVLFKQYQFLYRYEQIRGD